MSRKEKIAVCIYMACICLIAAAKIIAETQTIEIII